jgi:hypothetical protein
MNLFTGKTSGGGIGPKLAKAWNHGIVRKDICEVCGLNVEGGGLALAGHYLKHHGEAVIGTRMAAGYCFPVYRRTSKSTEGEVAA